MTVNHQLKTETDLCFLQQGFFYGRGSILAATPKCVMALHPGLILIYIYVYILSSYLSYCPICPIKKWVSVNYINYILQPIINNIGQHRTIGQYIVNKGLMNVR